MTPAQPGPSAGRLARLGRGILFLPGRWWLWLDLGLLLMAAHQWGPDLALRLVLLPASQGQAATWLVERHDNSFLEGRPGQVRKEAAHEQIRLEQPLSSLSAYAIWNAPWDGLYTLTMTFDDYGRLWIRRPGHLHPGARDQRGQPDGKNGGREGRAPHLLRVDLFNQIEKGCLTLRA